jgi:cytolysin-activating lysine-acyltransferase
MNDKPKAAAKPAAKAAAAPQPAKAMANANAAQAQRAAALSNIVALMIRDPKFRVMKIADLEWLVMPAIVSGQWQLAQGTTPAGEKKPGAPAQPGRMFPVAAALWARVSPAVDARLSSNLDKPMMLKPQEWTSGDIVWIIAVPGQAQYLKNFLQHLQTSIFKGRTVKIRSVANGKPAVRTLADLLGKASAPAKGK